MNSLLKSFISLILGLTTLAAFGSEPTPTALITDNQTFEESNAFVHGTPSPYPSSAKLVNVVPWNLVKFVCFGHTVNNVCTAEIEMATNTAHPIFLGTLSMNLKTGLITPSSLKAHGYTLTVLGAGKTMITKD